MQLTVMKQANAQKTAVKHVDYSPKYVEMLDMQYLTQSPHTKGKSNVHNAS